MNSPANSSPSNPSEYTGCLPVLLRLFWMGVGNFLLFALALVIGQSKDVLFSRYDVLFAALVLLCILARYLDIAYFQGATADGEPATLRDWRRYSVVLVLVSLVIWAGAHGVAHFM